MSRAICFRAQHYGPAGCEPGNETAPPRVSLSEQSRLASTGASAMKPVVIAAAVVVGGTSLALAAPPSYDIPKICKQIAGTEGSVMAAMSHQACMDAEQSARSDLTRRWSSIPEAIRKDCEETERALGPNGSYAALQSCIRASITAAEWRKANPERAAGGSEGRGGGVGQSRADTGTGGSGTRSRVGSAGVSGTGDAGLGATGSIGNRTGLGSGPAGSTLDTTTNIGGGIGVGTGPAGSSLGTSGSGLGRTGPTGASGVSTGATGNAARVGIPGSSGGSGVGSTGIGSTGSAGGTTGGSSTGGSSGGGSTGGGSGGGGSGGGGS